MWNEILQTDDNGIALFCALQQQVSEHYRKTMTPVRLKRSFGTYLFLRAFTYTDANYTLTLLVHLKDSTTLRIQSAGLQSYKELSQAILLINTKVIALMGEYNVKKMWARMPIETLNDSATLFSEGYKVFPGIKTEVASVIRPGWREISVELP